MATFFLPFAFLMFIFHCEAKQRTVDGQCANGGGTTQTVTLNILTHRNTTGQWVTTFSAIRDEDKRSAANNFTLDVSHSVTECVGRRKVNIRGVLADNSAGDSHSSKEKELDKLRFHLKCGSNVAIMDYGRNVLKINMEDPINSVVFTNRPLQDDELFEVRLDKKLTKFSHSLAVGATTHSPTDVAFPNHINHLTTPSWAFYHANIYHNGSLVFKNYGKDLNTLMVGDRIGVMRSSTGNLHYFINGIDQGPAASNVPHAVYGLLELWYNAAMATILDDS